ncbi:hypothetical protein KZX46_00730 (plasmid) [Polymorphobacter sp. PAMC 29334]|uniref:hypothetical protein n=1 Tax=Polymorphobacter sp. PAMC 29334 TaxID=2862331 RepID=UPI001C78B864|nr:hypothetical protein [Polymorphobacter sp. PAMC 29334]QYE33356.1 hypothetical protein KZX46_00730 [Polymorphobacter sp. PAMC 29334]
MGLRVAPAARERVPPGAEIIRVERLTPAFIKYHLNNGQTLHHFRREEPRANPHDHPWGFETEILTGGYVEEVFHALPGGGWNSELVHRAPGTVHQIEARHIHRIVALPAGDCWTLVRAGPSERSVRFWKFGATIKSRAHNRRRFVERRK